MCGINGILEKDPRREVDRARLVRMRETLRHRGPDGCGLWIEGPVGLGHRRLAIVDPEGGHQPMSTGDGEAWIVFNGEIYNHPELRAQLEAQGHRYRTRCDTETILHLYQLHGERCVERLQGMFAFAIWDRRRQSLLLARDRLGIKPLYYAESGDELLFGSEIKAILAARAQRPELNRAVLPDYLCNRYVATGETFFRGVRKLEPGRTLLWTREHGLRERRYWQLPAQVEDPGASHAQVARTLREKLEATVRSHLMADVPIGVFLSGGLDSSGLAALMAGMVTRPLRSFSVGFAEAEANELPYARLAARAIHAEHREVVLSPRAFFDALPRLIWHEDEPIAFPSSVPLYFVSRLARPYAKVVLTGEGADELFLGYNRYRVTAWNERMARRLAPWIPAERQAALRRFAERLPARLRRYARRSFLTLPPGPRSLFYENFAVFTEERQEELLAGALAERRDPHALGLALYREGSGEPLDRMSRADLQTYLVELLMKQDQMSMAASIESRVPFLDHRLVEWAVALPARYKLRGWQTKAVLRTALREQVPRPILTRKKMGFPVPLGRWLREGFWPLVEELALSERARARGHFRPEAVQRLADEHRSGQADHADRLWLLINLELWQRVFIDAETPVELAAAA